mgnify:CR=1 FL=1
MRVLINHLGYDVTGPKRAIVSAGEARSLSFQLRRIENHEVCLFGSCAYRGFVDGWRRDPFWSIDFSLFRETGTYYLEIREDDRRGGDSTAHSEPFVIAEHRLFSETFSNLLYWFKGQRSSGVEEVADRAASFYGERRETVDLRGGWFDASGDTSKYLSHLSYANYLNPQQTPGVVWSMLSAHDALGRVAPAEPALWGRRLLDEIGFGADFLLRMQDPAGYFYLTLFDVWSKDPSRRIVSSFRTQEGIRGDDYQAGYRQGGGMAIAALARAGALGLRLQSSPPEERELRAATPGRSALQPEALLPGEYPPERYLEAARRGFDHLEEHNTDYLDDGKENIIDDYCALLAATELYIALGEERYILAGRRRAEQLTARLVEEGGTHYWKAGDGERPYYHAAEAGLPTLALIRYGEAEAIAGEGVRRQEALETAARALRAELAVTGEVANPFGYARQHVSEPGGPRRSAFFIPHRNESGYWWQGENGRIASLAAAAFVAGSEGAAGVLPVSEQERSELEAFGYDQLGWILGCNPFDLCMLDGLGRNNPEYEAAFPNAPGGICNGITAGVEDESDIAFLPEPWGEDPLHRWRWSEQWIPHAGWFLLAVSTLRGRRRAGR